MVDNRRLPEAISAKEKGLALYRQGDFEQARLAFEEARGLFAAAGDRQGEGEMLNNLGAIHMQAERWEETEAALQAATALFVAAGDAQHRAQVLGNLGELHRRRGESEEAVANLKEAAAFFHQTGEREKEASTWQLASRIRLGQGRWLEAMHFYDLAISAMEKPSLGRRLLRRLMRLPASLITRGG